MRYVEATLTRREALHPAERRLLEADDVTRERVYHVDLLDDGSARVLHGLSGNVDRIREIAAESDLTDVRISAGDELVTVFARFDPHESLVELLSLVDDRELMLDTPIEYTADGGYRVLVVGREGRLRDALRGLPEAFDVSLRRQGEYEPEPARLFERLTPRQQTTLLAAIDAGYYRSPREATQQDVAERLDRSNGTVGEHLRKVEATVLTAIAPR